MGHPVHIFIYCRRVLEFFLGEWKFFLSDFVTHRAMCSTSDNGSVDIFVVVRSHI